MKNEHRDISRIVIFTDMDGTLLDRETYSYEQALPAIELVKSRGIPLVLCSAKTRAEQELYREALGIRDPFIVEDGGAIYIEEDYFPFPYEHHRVSGSYRVIEFGIPYRDIRRAVSRVATETGLPLRGYGDMEVHEVAAATGLSPGAARRAMEREYEVQIVADFNRDKTELLRRTLAASGLRTTHGGRFHGVMGHEGKGAAVKRLTELFRRYRGEIHTVGIGDSSNDLSLLASVDRPVLVRKIGGTWEKMDVPGLERIDAVGPAGWCEFILELLS
jgi:mannosyl-3-phosphoglycerate phosphatase